MGELPAKASEKQIATAVAAAVARLGASHSIMEIAAGAWHLTPRPGDPGMAALEPKATHSS